MFTALKKIHEHFTIEIYAENKFNYPHSGFGTKACLALCNIPFTPFSFSPCSLASRFLFPSPVLSNIPAPPPVRVSEAPELSNMPALLPGRVSVSPELLNIPAPASPPRAAPSEVLLNMPASPLLPDRLAPSEVLLSIPSSGRRPIPRSSVSLLLLNVPPSLVSAAARRLPSESLSNMPDILIVDIEVELENFFLDFPSNFLMQFVVQSH